MSRLASLALVAVFALPACFSEVDVDLPDYSGFYSVEVTGEAPGHGDTVRRMFASPEARQYAGVGQYPVGSLIVKEIYDRNDDDTAGALRYIAIQRKLEVAPDGGELENGWMFTYKADESAAETYRPRCWSTCHRQAPFDGTFLNWSEL